VVEKNKMRTAFLIKINGKTAELVTHGPAVEVKKQFLSIDIKKDETLLMLGTDIRPKRRGGKQDINAYLEIVEKENKEMRDTLAKKQKEREELAAKLKGQPAKTTADPKSIRKADEGKSAEVIAIKAQQSAKHTSPKT
jgi:hypothetical protein